MVSQERAQIRLILEHNLDLSRTVFERRLKELKYENAAKGLLKSGGTIKAGIRIMEELATSLVKETTDQAIEVSRQPETFSLIQEAFNEFQGFLRAELDPLISIASGSTRESGRDASIYQAADQLFAEQDTRTRRQLELHRFSFVGERIGATQSVQVEQEQKNPGGRPLSRHWDEMWAAIAVMLYVGDLKPKTQSDIEGAMKDWLVRHDLDAGDTPVRERARALWRQFQAAE